MAWVDAPPTVAGTAGRGWELLPESRAGWEGSPDVRVEWQAGLAWWMLQLDPRQHPAWDWYHLAVVHLRDLEGQEHLVRRHFPAATHELGVYALDPAQCPPAPPPAMVPFLMPPNVVVQFACVNDEDAAQLAGEVAAGIVRGYIGVESMGGQTMTEANSAEWRDAIAETLEHIVTGGHAPE